MCFLVTANAQDIPAPLAGLVTQESNGQWLYVKNGTNLDKETLVPLLLQGFGYPSGDELLLMRSQEDAQGLVHHHYRHFHGGYPVEGSEWFLHEDASGRVYLANGKAQTAFIDASALPQLPEHEALKKALDETKATAFAWEYPAYETLLKQIRKDGAATYFPKGELAWWPAPLPPNAGGKVFTLAYKFDLYAVKPEVFRRWYYVDAHTGRVIGTLDIMATGCFEQQHDCQAGHLHNPAPPRPPMFMADSLATGIANYVNANGGVVSFTSKDTMGQFVLHPCQVGPLGSQEIHTLHANNNWDYSNLTDFTDTDNFWDSDTVAVGAHWATEQTYQYFLQAHGRNSLNGNGMPLTSIVHFGQGYVNAFWDGTKMTYGDGNNSAWGPLTSMDVVAHEMTHGVTEFNGTGGLVYFNESGALNESFSDIFGAVVEFEAHPEGGDWLMGEDFDFVNGDGFRNMQNPNLEGHPKTYYGLHWYTGFWDNGGVHINSGVQNHWFYLLAEGGSGTNEYGYNFNVPAIGLDTAAAIAYRNLVTYLTPNSTYLDARNGSVQAAIDLYGAGAAQVMAVEEAWCAVGVGIGCMPTIAMITPTASEVLTAGTNYDILWNTTLLPPTSQVKIEFTTDTIPDPVWQLIEANVANTGTYNWFVVNQYSDQVRVRISDAGDPTVPRPGNPLIFGISDTFEIQPCIAANSFSGPTFAGLGDSLVFTSLVGGVSFEWQVNGTVVGNDSILSYLFPDYGPYQLQLTVESAMGCLNIETKTVHILTENHLSFGHHIGEWPWGDYVQDVLQTQDGGYAIIIANGSHDRLAKFDTQGNLLWYTNTLLNGPYSRYSNSTLVEKPDGNLMVFYTLDAAHTGTSNHTIAVAELDGYTGALLGDIRPFSCGANPNPRKVIKKGSNWLVCGDALVNNQPDIFFLELDSNLTIVQQHWLGDSLVSDFFTDIIPAADGGFLVGYTTSDVPVFNQWGYVIVKLDSTMVVQWKKRFHSYVNNGHPSTSGGSRMRLLEIPDCGGFMVMASAGFLGETYLLKTDFLGNLLWAKGYNSQAPAIPYHNIRDIIWDKDQGITMLSNSVSDAISSPGINLITGIDYHLSNLDYDGNVNWARRIVNIDDNIDYTWYRAKLIKTSDGGYMSAIPGRWLYGTEVYLLKTDRLGLQTCQIETLPTTVEDFVFYTETNFNTDQASAQPFAALPLVPNSGFALPMFLDTICAAVTLNSVTAAFRLDEDFVESGATPVIINQSIGADTFLWEVNGTASAFPLPPFNASGLNEIKLTAIGNGDTSSVTRNVYVKSAPQLGQLDFTATPQHDAGLFLFQPTITGPHFLYFWEFGDSSSQDTGSLVLHNFYHDTAYQVCLSVVSCEEYATFCKNVVVDCSPPAPPVQDTTICAGGRALLTANDTLPGVVHWFETMTDTLPVAIGPVFETPVLNSPGTVDYFVEKYRPADTLTVGLTAGPGPTIGSYLGGHVFSSNSFFKFQSVDILVYFSGTLEMKVFKIEAPYPAPAAEIYSQAITGSFGEIVTMHIDQVFPPGTYALVPATTSTGRVTAYYDANGFGYPLGASGYPGIFKIEGWVPSEYVNISPHSHLYPSFFNYQVSLHEDCLSERIPVLVTVEDTPANDTCQSALSLPVDGSTHNFHSVCAGEASPLPACTSTPAGDVWFSFTTPPSGFVKMTLGGQPHFGYALYDGCGNVPIACHQESSGSAGLSVVHGGLTPGQSYLVQYWSETPLSAGAQITLSDGCPPLLALNGLTLPNGDYQGTAIESDGSVAPSSDVTFRAADSILLNPGFEVAQGGVFLAEMTGCQAVPPVAHSLPGSVEDE